MREASKDCVMYPKSVIQAFRAERFKLSRFENKAQNREHTLPTSHDKLSRFMFVSAFIGGGINNHPCLKLQQHIVLNLTYYYLGLLGWRPKNSQPFLNFSFLGLKVKIQLIHFLLEKLCVTFSTHIMQHLMLHMVRFRNLILFSYLVCSYASLLATFIDQALQKQ